MKGSEDKRCLVRVEPGLGDDIPCSKCGAIALDTGLECNACGHDMMPEIYPEDRSNETIKPLGLSISIEQANEITTLNETHRQRIAELEAENERLLKEKASLALARKMDESYERDMANLRERLAETIPVMQRSLDYLEEFAKPMPPILQLALINTIIRASDAAVYDAAMEGE